MRTMVVLSVLLAVAGIAPAKEKKPDDLSRVFETPVDRVYTAVMRVAASDYNLDSKDREAGIVRFHALGGPLARRNSWVYIAVCDDAGEGKTRVTLRIERSASNKELPLATGYWRRKFAGEFWKALDNQLQAAAPKAEKVP